MREALLTEAVRLVPTHGWTRTTLQEAARSLQLPPTAHGLVRGEVDLVSFFVERCNAELGATLGWTGEERAQAVGGMTMREMLSQAARVRLENVVPFAGTWSQALGVLAVPYNVPTAAQLLHATSDEILHVCGDQSVDFSWYTKRALLSVAYSSAELFMLSDLSPGKQDTWEFLDRRINNYADALQTTSQVTKFF